jgi:hypothetical protein
MATYILSDIHGYYSHLISLLLQAKLIDHRLTWLGVNSTLCLAGDFVNRGPESITVIDFLISLQIQAELLGGRVIVLLGNHEAVLVAAHRFRERINRRINTSFLQTWRDQGESDTIDYLTPEHIAWMTHLPAMVLLEDRLIIHADAPFYLDYGDNIDAVNARFEALMRSYDPDEWADWLADFAEHRIFMGANGMNYIQQFLAKFGGKQIIHGHTAITSAFKLLPAAVNQPKVYASGLAMNVDCGITHGGEGFIYRLD